MDIVLDVVVTLSRWSRGHLSAIALTLMATLLVLFGPSLNGWLRRQIGGFNFLLRTLLFMIFCALVYGFGIVFVTPWLVKGLAQLNNYSLAPVLMLAFILLGIIADRR